MNTHYITRRRFVQISALLAAALTACSKTAPHAALPEGSTILALGDSLTAGYGADATAAYPAVLAGFTGWQVINGKPESWQVEDGILFTTGKGGGWLSTTREFQDFRLVLEFRVPADGNSGVFIRSPHQGDPAYSGMEIQVLDDYAAIYSKLKPWQYTGSIYGVQAPAQLVSKSAGQWQKMVITCMGARVQVDLNGIKTIDANLIEHMDKCREHPGLQRRGGYIGLQNHSTRLEYRNIKLEELR